MGKIYERGFRWDWLGAVLMAVAVYSCANKGYPEGGPKDVTPPVVVKEVPVSNAVNFDGKRVEIYFDEFVQLKDIGEKFVFSPPLKKKPKVRLKGKYVQVNIEDTLKPNTTYSMDFADAIVDNNESNPLGFYRYVFSTGSSIDSLELSGKVVDAMTGEPVLNALLALYENQQDSTPLLELPSYVARTDSSGNFRVTNLKKAGYKVIAIGDDNKDNKYTPESERIACMDTVVSPMVMPMVRVDTFKVVEKVVQKDTVFRDSIVRKEYMGFGPTNLYLRMYKEDLTQLYLVDGKRKEREKLDFVFSIPAENRFKAVLWDTLAAEKLPEDWYFIEQNAGKDSISLWIKDSTVYKKDTLNMILSYLRTDSTGVREVYADTSRFTFKEKKTGEGKSRKKGKEPEKKASFLDIRSNVTDKLELGGRLVLELGKPADRSQLACLRLSVKVDTLYEAVPYTLSEDSATVRKVYVDAAWEEGKEYRLELDSASVHDLYGDVNDGLEKNFKVRTREEYGKLILHLKGVEGETIVQLFQAGEGKTEKGEPKIRIVKEKKCTGDGSLVFDLLPEGKYRLRAVLDADGDGKWTTGLYLKHRQPEKIVFLPVEITVKQNFDIEQEFDLNASPDGKAEV